MKGFDRRILRLAPSVRAWAAVLALLIAAATAGTVAFAAGAAGLLAQLIGAPAWPHPFALLIGGGALRAGAGAARDIAAARAGSRAEAEVRHRLLTALGAHGARSVQGQRDQLASLAGARLGSVADAVGQVLPTAVAATLIPVALGGLVLLLDPWSAGVLAVTLPVVIVFLALVGLATRDRAREQWARLAVLSARFLDLVRGLPSLRVYGRAERQAEQVQRDAEEYRRGSMSVLRTAFLSGFVLDVGATLSVALVAVGVGLRLNGGHLEPRVGFVVLLLVPEVFAPVRALGAAYHQQVAGESAVGEVLDAIDDEGANVPTARRASADSLLDVSLDVPGRRGPVLDGLSMVLQPGEVVALTGRSGTGKSTVLALLLGHVAPTLGSVHAAAGGPRACWVPQDPRPTAATAGDELLLAVPDAPTADVEAALRDCAAPTASTPLGEDGQQLSAGERRRLALAVALLRARAVRSAGSMPLVLLDEPTEGLDGVTAHVVATLLDRLRGWSTVLVVTHDVRLARACDRTLHLDHGRAWTPPLVIPVDGDDTIGVMAAPDRAHRAADAAEPAAATSDRLIGWALRGAGRRGLAVAGAASAAAAASAVALTATSVWLVCRAAQQPGVQALALAVVGVRGFALARALLRYAERLAGHDVALTVLARVRALVFARLVPQAPAGFDRWRRGDLLRRFTTDTDAVQDLVVRVGQPVVTAATASLTALGIVAVASPHSFALALTGQLIAVPLALAVGVAGSRLTGSVARAAAERDRLAVAAVESHAVLTTHTAWSRVLSRLATYEHTVSRLTLRQSMNGTLTTLVATTGSLLSIAAVLTTPVHHVAVAAAVGALLAAGEAGAGITGAAMWLGRVRDALGRVDEVIGEDSPATAPGGAGIGGPVSLMADDVLLRWPGGPVLTVGSSIAVTPGTRVAVTGPSGAGKSTLLTALSGLLEPVAGRIVIASPDGVADLADLAPDVRAKVVCGSLDGDHVFDVDVRANVTLGRPATDAAVLRALAAAGLRDWVVALPDGLSTPVGADGARLSGGQRQRLLIARALLDPPAVLLLDEPTAHLDPATEADVTAGIIAALRGRTAVVVTHRPAVVDACTEQLRVQSGQIVHDADVPGRVA